MTISEFKESVKNKKIAVVGVGISNLPLARMLAACGCIRKFESCIVHHSNSVVV